MPDFNPSEPQRIEAAATPAAVPASGASALPHGASASERMSPAPVAPSRNDEFLDDFMASMEDSAPARPEPAARVEEPVFRNPSTFAVPPVQMDGPVMMEARPVVAERDLRQAFPMESGEAAMALAAMPHYEMGGKTGLRVSGLEMRWLLAEAKTTLADTAVTPPVVDEDGDRLVKGPLVEHHEALAKEVDQSLKALVAGGYLRPVRLSGEEARDQGAINEVIQAGMPSAWGDLGAGADHRTAYEMTDLGIAAGRSLRGWDGRGAEAGLIRLKGGAEMPQLVASESYAISALMMENRAMAGVLKQGEMGAYYRAELQNLAYRFDQGADPVATAGRLDALVDSASFVALEQIEGGVDERDAPLTQADLKNLADGGAKLLDRLPDGIEVAQVEGPSEWMSMDKAESRALLARLNGVRAGMEFIAVEREAMTDSRILPEAWKSVAQDQKDDALVIRNALTVAKGWLAQVATRGQDLHAEVMAMASGAFGERGTAVARQVLGQA